MRFTYDVAISFAEEDNAVAAQIAAALHKRGIRYYYYKEREAESWGDSILRLVGVSYGMHSRYVLLITSAVYVNKYWSGVEVQIAYMFRKLQEQRVLQLRLDNTPVDGISRHIAFQEWRNNPGEIADLLQQKINKQVGAERRRWTRSYMITLIILLFIAMIYLFAEPVGDDLSPVLPVRKMPVYSAADTFYISETEVTVGQYREYCKEKGIDPPPQHPSAHDSSPVVNVTWEEALAFCRWKGGRLPTEREWEYAAGAGLAVRYSGGNNAARVAVYNRKKPSWVASRSANAFGLYDMTGNVAEWCSDWFDLSATYKSVRGGCYHSVINPVNELAIIARSRELPGNRRPDIGFRVAWDKE